MGGCGGRARGPRAGFKRIVCIVISTGTLFRKMFVASSARNGHLREERALAVSMCELSPNDIESIVRNKKKKKKRKENIINESIVVELSSNSSGTTTRIVFVRVTFSRGSTRVQYFWWQVYVLTYTAIRPIGIYVTA